MATLPDNLLATAELLAASKTRLGSAALRRSVSTSYYALFSKLAGLCAEKISRAEPGADSFKSVYRALDHGHARKILSSHSEFASPLGDDFQRLQEARHWADYSVESHPEAAKASAGARFSRAEAQQFVDVARDAVKWVDDQTAQAKQRLAVALIARSRR